VPIERRGKYSKFQKKQCYCGVSYTRFYYVNYIALQNISNGSMLCDIFGWMNRWNEVIYLITDTYPISGLKDCLTEVDICKEFRIEIFVLADICNLVQW